MTGSRRDHGDFVRKVQQDTHRYLRDLLAETEQLRARVAVLESERDRLSEIASRACELEERLLRAEQDRERFSSEYAAIEEQSSSLANLYVASYRLHGTVNGQEVLASIQEIVANLIGSEEMALFEVAPDGAALSLLAWQGLDPARYRRLGLDRGLIAQAVRTGEVLIVERDARDGARPEEEHLTACVPLKLCGRVTRALAFFRLLPQKESFGPLDGELFDLLATPAAVALHGTAFPVRASAALVAAP